MIGHRSAAGRLRVALGLLLIAEAALAARSGAGEAVEAAVVDAGGKPVADAVVFVYELPGRSFPPPAEPLVMDQIRKEFVPHVLPVLVGSSVRFPNMDDIHHHLYSFSPAKTFELPLYKGTPAQPVVFDKKGVVKLGCNIHDWMSAVVLVLQNPYFAVTDAEGRARLPRPAGRGWELAVFHERLAGPVDATRRKALPGREKISWTISLKPERKRRQPAPSSL